MDLTGPVHGADPVHRGGAIMGLALGAISHPDPGIDMARAAVCTPVHMGSPVACDCLAPRIKTRQILQGCHLVPQSQSHCLTPCYPSVYG